MNIAVCGYFGMGNFGDELFLRTWQQVLHPHRVIPYNSRIDSDHIDAVIVGGGDLIIPYHYNSNYFPPQLMNHPTWVYGVGVVDNYPESTWPQQEVQKHRTWISRANGLYVRDDHSAGLCRRMQLHKQIVTVPDMVFAYEEPHYPIVKSPFKKTIGLCIHAYSSFPFEFMARMMAEYAIQGLRVLILPVLIHAGNPFSDYLACKDLQQRIQELEPEAKVELPPVENELELTYSLIQSVDYLITFKLHPAIAAIRAGVPVLCISKMSKVYQLLAQFGLEDNYCDASSPEEQLEEQIRLFIDRGNNPMQAIAARVKAVERESRHALLQLKKEIEHSLHPH